MPNDIGGCNAALILNFESDNLELETQLYILDVVDESTYNQTKKGIALGATVPVRGVDIDFDGSYDDFKEKREYIFKKYKYERNEKRSEEKLRQYISPDALDKWYKCKQLFADRQMNGVKGWVVSTSDSRCIVNIGWYPAPTAERTGVVTKSSLSGGTVAGVPEGNVFRNGERFINNSVKSVAIDRINDQTIVLTVDINGTTCYLEVPGNPEANKPIIGVVQGQKTSEIPFKNKRNVNVKATITVTFELVGQPSDGIGCTVRYCMLRVFDNGAWKVIRNSERVNWAEGTRLVPLAEYSFTAAAGEEIKFEASIGEWDHFNIGESKIRWEINIDKS